MKKVYLGAVYKQEDGGLMIDFPDFDCAVSEGNDIKELMDNASDMLKSYVDNQVEHNESIPEPTEAEEIGTKLDPDNGTPVFMMPVAVYPPQKTERFNLTTTGDKLAIITEYGKRNHISRSELMVNATLEYINQH